MKTHAVETPKLHFAPSGTEAGVRPGPIREPQEARGGRGVPRWSEAGKATTKPRRALRLEVSSRSPAAPFTGSVAGWEATRESEEMKLRARTTGAEPIYSSDNYTEDELGGSGDYDSMKEPCFRDENAHFNRIFLPTVYSIIFLTGIVGNGLVILVMGYQKKLRSMTDKYRLHLSVADLLFVLTLPFWAVDAVANWYFGNFLCKAVHVIYTVNLYSSVLILAFISLDRYLAIVHATNSQRPRKLLAEKVVYVGVWIPALLLTIPDLIFANIKEVEDKYACDRFYPNDLWVVVFQFQHIMVGLILPGIVILSCYCIIISKLSHSKGYQKRKALKTTVILILAFFACWLPYYIGISIDSFILLEIITQGCEFQNTVHKWISITEALAFFHCCLNPILYAFLGAKFKTSAQHALTSVSRGSSLKILSKGKRDSLLHLVPRTGIICPEGDLRHSGFLLKNGFQQTCGKLKGQEIRPRFVGRPLSRCQSPETEGDCLRMASSFGTAGEQTCGRHDRPLSAKAVQSSP
ncbi:C-X-C chemokine receptor type 4 [Galemys pyrenaicus]|uniref:C-X-C chemokine receptor type 4 n=1 Tax=Galemys pyrenaicus TaxID=202257 RepID=A0A8J6B5W5_GALPY|nr:C-X-C chemokine receptor type 4 [Galemys pyrenaicus]